MQEAREAREKTQEAREDTRREKTHEREEERGSPNKGNQTGCSTPHKSPGGRIKQLAKRGKNTPPLKNSSLVFITRKEGSDASHAGIVRAFKPPAQDGKVHPVEGQKFTSLKELERARLHKQKTLGKKD